MVLSCISSYVHRFICKALCFLTKQIFLPLKKKICMYKEIDYRIQIHVSLFRLLIYQPFPMIISCREINYILSSFSGLKRITSSFCNRPSLLESRMSNKKSTSLLDISRPSILASFNLDLNSSFPTSSSLSAKCLAA